MPNMEQLERLRRSVADWNEWRRYANSVIDLSGAKLRNANLIDADLNYANLNGANLTGASLSYAYLRNATLIAAYLLDAHLSGANLRNANLSYANLSNADLSGANLRDAHLSNANLNNANLTEADLTHTVLDPANTPNGGDPDDVWEEDGDYLIGYRTREHLHQVGPNYEVGHEYVAPVFSTCSESKCHPGLYVCRLREEVKGEDVIRVRFQRADLHSVGKHRVRRFTVMS